MTFNLVEYIENHKSWSQATFGDVASPGSVIAHIEKELAEIMDDPSDLVEWVDVIILAIDGACRFTGHSPSEICAAFEIKQQINMSRKWPDPIPGQPTEHIRAEPTE